MMGSRFPLLRLEVARRLGKVSMSAKRAVLIGDSHSYAIQRAIQRRESKGMSIPLVAHRLLKEKNGKPLGDTRFEDFLNLAGNLNKNDAVFSVLGGNQYAVFSMVRHPIEYDFFDDPDSLALTEQGIEVVPYHMIKEYFEEGVGGRDGVALKALRKATSARVIHIIPPPPKRDNDFIIHHHETRFTEERITEMGVSPPSLRMKCWRLQARVLTEICSDLGIDVMFPPSDSLDSDGYLKQDFYANDATHANPAYGELLLKDIEQHWLVNQPSGEQV